jgi:Tfp pilus assembly protein PilP
MLPLAAALLSATLSTPQPAPDPLDPVPPGPQSFAYPSENRRDPFVARSSAVVDAPKRPAQPRIGDLALKGIVKTPSGWKAMLEDDDHKVQNAVVGTRLHDGQVTAIDEHTVTFRQDVKDPLSPVKVREIRKTLHAAD